MSFQEFKPRQFQQLPMVVKNILIINIVLFVGKFLLADKIDLDRYLDLFPIGSEYFKPHQFITYMFMHADFWHLFFNMLALWVFGAALENLWGPKRFLTFYIIAVYIYTHLDASSKILL